MLLKELNPKIYFHKWWDKDKTNSRKDLYRWMILINPYTESSIHPYIPLVNYLYTH